MENCPNNYLVDSLEGKELKMFWRYKQPSPENQDEVYSAFLFLVYYDVSILDVLSSL